MEEKTGSTDVTTDRALTVTGPRRPSASMRAAARRAGADSVDETWIRAPARVSRSSHCATRVVLPAPAGPLTRMVVS